MTPKQLIARQNKRVKRLEKLCAMRNKLSIQLDKIKGEIDDLVWLIDKE